VVVAGVIVALVVVFYDPTAKVREVVAAKLNDPGSAEFRNIREISPGKYCGEVNFKNRRGDYVGFTPFTAFEAETTPGKRDWFAAIGGLGAGQCGQGR
jgi:hypothetical protein